MQSLLQVWYVGVAVFGFLRWSRDGTTRISLLSWRGHIAGIAGILASLMIRAGKVGSIARESPGSSGAWRAGISRPRRPPAKLRRAIAFS
jgi:hypothetical protein